MPTTVHPGKLYKAVFERRMALLKQMNPFAQGVHIRKTVAEAFPPTFIDVPPTQRIKEVGAPDLLKWMVLVGARIADVRYAVERPARHLHADEIVKIVGQVAEAHADLHIVEDAARRTFPEMTKDQADEIQMRSLCHLRRLSVFAEAYLDTFGVIKEAEDARP